MKNTVYTKRKKELLLSKKLKFIDAEETFHSRTTTSAWVSNSNIRPSESVIAAKVPLGDKVSFSPFLGWSFKHVKGEAGIIQYISNLFNTFGKSLIRGTNILAKICMLTKWVNLQNTSEDIMNLTFFIWEYDRNRKVVLNNKFSPYPLKYLIAHQNTLCWNLFLGISP